MSNIESNDNINEFVFSNYEKIQEDLVKYYDVYIGLKEKYDSIFINDITKQYVQNIHSYLVRYIAHNTLYDTEIIRIYVEDKFTFDNIERILNDTV